MAVIHTIGFTKKSAEEFFGLLRSSGVARLLDVRLNNVSQLAGFTKMNDLRYFLREICGIEYEHVPQLAPLQDMLSRYRDDGDWARYETEFLDLMVSRSIETVLSPDVVDAGCLLCSEPTPHRCHRRLVAEYLRDRWGSLEITHL